MDFLENLNFTKKKLSCCIKGDSFFFDTSQVDSARFGLIQILETFKKVKKGEEIYSFYGYADFFIRNKGREWYYGQWQAYKKAFPNSPKIKYYETQGKIKLNLI